MSEKQATDELLAERGNTHGNFTDQASLTQDLKREVE
jgi:hypothetical protein